MLSKNMERTEWVESVERLKAILKDAQDTHIKSAKDIEELEFAIFCYEKKIEELSPKI